MRDLVFQMMTTLDGRVDDPDAWVAGIGDDLFREIDRCYAEFDTILVGRVTYEEMVGFWPGAGKGKDASEALKSMAHRMNTYRKFVFTTGPEKELPWNNAKLVSVGSDEDVVKFVRDLKEQDGRGIHLSGGARLARTLVGSGLVDEYHFFAHPAASPGARWSDGVAGKLSLDLMSTKSFSDGVVGLYYRAR